MPAVRMKLSPVNSAAAWGLLRSLGTSQATSVELDQPLGLALAGVEVDAGGVDGGARIHGRQLADHGVGRVDAGLGFCGARLGAAAQPFDLRSDTVAQALLLAALRFEIGLLLFKKTAEVSFDAQQAVGKDAIQLDDLARCAIQENNGRG